MRREDKVRIGWVALREGRNEPQERHGPNGTAINHARHSGDSMIPSI